MLARCPRSPNCVSSIDHGNRHGVRPLVYTDSRQHARVHLQRVLSQMRGAALIKEQDNVLHYTFITPWFRFTDDVLFYFMPDKKVIHMRSASRLGYYDFGVNRRRIERIRKVFCQVV
ncbi:MAG: hypothetical protein BMS9Abin36_1006 [Gammaproteobacteria bacterium]|nr:MAG: hypothetical protein BMS9Abin36_1006 [Gammaproteobacteria bacterium]